MIIMLIISQFAPRNFPALILSCCRIVKFVGVFKTVILDGSVYQDFVCVLSCCLSRLIFLPYSRRDPRCAGQ